MAFAIPAQLFLTVGIFLASTELSHWLRDTRVGSHSFRTCRCPLEIHLFTKPSRPKSGPRASFSAVPGCWKLPISSALHSLLLVHSCWSNHQPQKLMTMVDAARFPSPGLLYFQTQLFLGHGSSDTTTLAWEGRVPLRRTDEECWRQEAVRHRQVT